MSQRVAGSLGDELHALLGADGARTAVIATLLGPPVGGRSPITRPVPATAYEARWEELVTAGYAWINLSHYGQLAGSPLIVIELPGAPRGVARTSVNRSGPSTLVLGAGGDASSVVSVEEERD